MNTQGFIKFIEENKLPCLIWHFNDCPLVEIVDLQPELTIEKNGEILSAIRCYVILHKKGIGNELIPQVMMEEFEDFPLEGDYELTIPIFFTEFDHLNENKE